MRANQRIVMMFFVFFCYYKKCYINKVVINFFFLPILVSKELFSTVNTLVY